MAATEQLPPWRANPRPPLKRRKPTQRSRCNSLAAQGAAQPIKEELRSEVKCDGVVMPSNVQWVTGFTVRVPKGCAQG